METVAVETADEVFRFDSRELSLGDITDDHTDSPGDGRAKPASNGSDATVVGDDCDRLTRTTMGENGSDNPHVSGFLGLV
jgi:hypothetical protein